MSDLGLIILADLCKFLGCGDEDNALAQAAQLQEYLVDDIPLTNLTLKNIVTTIEAQHPRATDGEFYSVFQQYCMALGLDEQFNIHAVMDTMKFLVAVNDMDSNSIEDIVNMYYALNETSFIGDWRAITYNINRTMLRTLLNWQQSNQYPELIRLLVDYLRKLTEEEINTLNAMDITWIRGRQN